MRKIWLVAANTYRPRVRSGTFLFLTFIMPILMIVVGAAFSIFLDHGGDLERLGYVDLTGQLAEVSQVEVEDGFLTLIRMENEGQAQAAIREDQIEGYLLIPSDFFQGQPAIFYGVNQPGVDLRIGMDRFMRRAMFPAAPEGLYERVDNPSEVTYVSLKTGEEITSEIGLVVYFATPAVLAVLYALSIMFMTGQLGSAVVREKEQRAMEIVITSLRPSELVAGKILGMALLALTQFGIWITGAVLAVVLFAPSGWDLQSLVFPWGAILWALPLILIGFLLFAVLGAGAGIIAGDSQQAQQVAALVGLLGFAPMWFLPFLIEQSESVLAVALTLFPLTATTVALIRMAFSEVPLWQLSASLVLLVLGLGLSTWLVARIFRAAMLIYGQTLRPVQIWRALRQA